MRSIRYLCLTAIGAVSLTTGCTSTVTRFTAGRVDSYKYHATQNGLAVAVRPVTDKREVRQVFQTDLLEKGVLPVLVAAENDNPSRSFILSKNCVSIKNAATGTTVASTHSKVSSEASGNAMATIGAVGVGVGSLGAAPLLFVGLKMASDAQVVELNLADKELRTHTIEPGQKAQGFAYFAFPKGSQLSEQDWIHVTVADPATSTATEFNFNLK